MRETPRKERTEVKDDNSGKFTYTYAAPGSEERKKIDRLRRRYAGGDGLSRLRELDAKVRRPPMLAALVLGITGVIVFGLGMSLALVWENFILSGIVGAAGIAVGVSAIPVYRVMLRRRKEKYSDEILRLSSELLGESRQSEDE